MHNPKSLWTIRACSVLMLLFSIVMLVNLVRQHQKRKGEEEARRTRIAAAKAVLDSSADDDAEVEGTEEFARRRTSLGMGGINIPPQPDDKSTWAYAYRLLHPDYNRQERAEEVVQLLTRDRDLSEIPPRELSLLYTAYNELSDADQQFEIAQELWKRAPGTHRALNVICMAMQWKYSRDNDSASVIEFVDTEIARGNGGERELLLLKATAMLWKEDLTEEEKAAVGDVVVEAMTHKMVQNPAYDYEFHQEPESFLKHSDPFDSAFSDAERAALVARINNSQAEKDVDSTPSE